MMTVNRSTGEWSLMARQQAAVARIGQLGLQGVELTVLIDDALEALAATLDVGYATLLELDGDWRSCSVRAANYRGQRITARQLASTRVPAGRDSMPGYTVMQGEVTATADLPNDQRFRSRASEYNTPAGSAVNAPVGWGERPWGVLGAYGIEGRDWTEDDLQFVQSMANTIGLAIFRSRAEDALRESNTRLELSLAATDLVAWSWDFTNDIIELSPGAQRVYGLDDGVTEITDDQFTQFVEPEDRPALRGSTYEALQTTGRYHVTYRWRNAARGDEVRWLETWGRVVDDNAGRATRLIGVTTDVTERRLAEDQRAALLAAEQQARREGERARDRLALLVEGAARFSASLDPNEVLASLPEFCVPRLADVCLVDLVGDDHVLVEAAVRAVDEESLALVRELRSRRAALGRGGIYSEAAVADRGRGVLVSHMTDEQFQAASVDDDHLAVFRRFGARSSVIVPLIARGRVLGVLSLLTNRSERFFTSDDLSLAQELADRAALAVDNGRLFESRNRVARSLQAALLPPKLPDIDGLELAARYQVAEDDIEIGGDFYDVIEMGERVFGLVVGDVCGRGPDAAAMTGLMRHSVRAAVVREWTPSGVLSQTNDAVLSQIDDYRFCTAAFLRVAIGSDGLLHLLASSAGHPQPIVLRADGTAEAVECGGLLLGVVPSPNLVDVTVTLGPGDSIILYTDGITEARRGTELFGPERLLDAVTELAGQHAEGVASGIVDAVRRFADDASDDQAVLVLRAPVLEGPRPPMPA